MSLDLMMSRYRFTPTGVGSSCSAAGGFGSSPVHPHGRGEQTWASLMPIE